MYAESFTIRDTAPKSVCDTIQETVNDTEDLGGYRIFISKTHRFGTDALLLAEFAKLRRKDVVCDLGTGCGILPFLLLRDYDVSSVTAVDIQTEAIDLLTHSVKHNNATRITPLLADLRTLPADLNGKFDAVICNPPYKASGTGLVSEEPGELIARHEVMCTQEDVCKAAYKLLKSGGRLFLINRAERLSDVICAMRGARVEPKRLQMIAKDPDTAPVLFLIEGRKDGKPFLKIAQPRFTA
jgi:tRNA1(Val) A37 N6-methylase TrmN6